MTECPRQLRRTDRVVYVPWSESESPRTGTVIATYRGTSYRGGRGHMWCADVVKVRVLWDDDVDRGNSAFTSCVLADNLVVIPDGPARLVVECVDAESPANVAAVALWDTPEARALVDVARTVCAALGSWPKLATMLDDAVAPFREPVPVDAMRAGDV